MKFGVLDRQTLFDLCHESFKGRLYGGGEPQEPERFAAAVLVFPSDEPPPHCWFDAKYRRALKWRGLRLPG